MLQDLGLKSTGATSIVKRYMNPTKLYKQQYEFYYAEEYKGDITSLAFGPWPQPGTRVRDSQGKES